VVFKNTLSFLSCLRPYGCRIASASSVMVVLKARQRRKGLLVYLFPFMRNKRFSQNHPLPPVAFINENWAEPSHMLHLAAEKFEKISI